MKWGKGSGSGTNPSPTLLIIRDQQIICKTAVSNASLISIEFLIEILRDNYGFASIIIPMPVIHSNSNQAYWSKFCMRSPLTFLSAKGRVRKSRISLKLWKRMCWHLIIILQKSSFTAHALHRNTRHTHLLLHTFSSHLTTSPGGNSTRHAILFYW